MRIGINKSHSLYNNWHWMSTLCLWFASCLHTPALFKASVALVPRYLAQSGELSNAWWCVGVVHHFNKFIFVNCRFALVPKPVFSSPGLRVQNCLHHPFLGEINFSESTSNFVYVMAFFPSFILRLQQVSIRSPDVVLVLSYYSTFPKAHYYELNKCKSS